MKTERGVAAEQQQNVPPMKRSTGGSDSRTLKERRLLAHAGELAEHRALQQMDKLAAWQEETGCTLLFDWL